MGAAEPFYTDFEDMMAANITVSQVLGRDTYGAITYGSPNTYKARVVYKTHNVIGPSGQLVSARGYAIIATIEPIDINDQVLLPDGTTPKLLVVTQESDETGPAYTRIDFQ